MEAGTRPGLIGHMHIAVGDAGTDAADADIDI